MTALIDYITAPPRILILVFLVSASFVHFRGRVRLKFGRQITDHSTLTAPYNALVYLFSRAPNRPFLEPDLFPDMAPITANWEVFREEGLTLMEQSAITASTGDNDIGFHTFFKRGWKRFYLSWYGHPLPSAARLCPRSVELLKAAPNIRAAMFATLPPGAKLGKHRDPFAGSLRYHLGLRTPNSDACWIEVDGERRSWRDGQALFFDETYVHEAFNGGDVTRLILFCDLERPVAPLFAPVNRWMIRRFMKATGTENEPGEGVGAVNRLYARLAGLQDAGKRLKARNRRLYYTVKYALMVLAAVLLLAPYPRLA